MVISGGVTTALSELAQATVAGTGGVGGANIVTRAAKNGFEDLDKSKSLEGTGDNKLIKNKFPNESLPSDGKIIKYRIENGRI